MPVNTNKHDISISAGIDFDEKGAQKASATISKTFVKNGKQIRDTVKMVNGKIKSVRRSMQDYKRQFDADALGVMFFGMAIRRVTDAIGKSAVSTFQDIMHSVEGNVTAFDEWDTAAKKVQFQMGQALEPMIRAFTPLMEWLAKVIDQNEFAFQVLFGTLVALGSLLATYGTLQLGMNALLNLFTKLVPVIKAVGSTIGWVAANPWTIWIAGIIAAIFWINKMQQAMGGWGEFFKSVARGTVLAIAAIVDAIVTAVSTVINVAIMGINWLIDKANNIPGVDLGKIDKWDYQFGDIMWGAQDFIESSSAAPSQGYATGFEGGLPVFDQQQGGTNIYITADSTEEIIRLVDSKVSSSGATLTYGEF